MACVKRLTTVAKTTTDVAKKATVDHKDPFLYNTGIVINKEPKMRITQTVTVNVRLPKFESVCREMWKSQDGMFTASEWRGIGIDKTDAIARTIADPVVREKFDAVIAKLATRKNVRQMDFYAENIAFDVMNKLSARHWIVKANQDLADKYYPYGF
jgi:hypothetical protein